MIYAYPNLIMCDLHVPWSNHVQFRTTLMQSRAIHAHPNSITCNLETCLERIWASRTHLRDSYYCYTLSVITCDLDVVHPEARSWQLLRFMGERNKAQQAKDASEWHWKGIKPLKRHKALKGNDRNGLMKLFLAFFTKALHTHYKRVTHGRTDTRSYRDARTQLKSRTEDIWLFIH